MAFKECQVQRGVLSGLGLVVNMNAQRMLRARSLNNNATWSAPSTAGREGGLRRRPRGGQRETKVRASRARAVRLAP